MMKTSILRSAAACRVGLAARSAQIISRSTASARVVARVPLASSYRPLNSLLRCYSSESAARQEGSAPASNGLITKFGDLGTLGVHKAVVDSIVSGMGYENMTEVQSMTINSALSGKDM